MTAVMEVLEPDTREQLCQSIKDAGVRTLEDLVKLVLPYFEIDGHESALERVAELQLAFKAAMRSEEGNPLYVRHQLTAAEKQAEVLSTQKWDPVTEARRCIAIFVASGQLVPADGKDCAECLFYRAAECFAAPGSSITPW